MDCPNTGLHAHAREMLPRVSHFVTPFSHAHIVNIITHAFCKALYLANRPIRH